MSRLLEIIGLFCRISSLLLGSFAKETYNLKEPTNRSHLIVNLNGIMKSLCTIIGAGPFTTHHTMCIFAVIASYMSRELHHTCHIHNTLIAPYLSHT